MHTYLISHGPKRPDTKATSRGMAAQTSIEARNESEAREKFAERFPMRVLRTIFQKP